MTCKARYRGLRPVFGVRKGTDYTLEIAEHAPYNSGQYLWIQIGELPEYLMPYCSMKALLTDWDFTDEGGTAYVDHIGLTDAWLDTYMPSEVTVCLQGTT